MVQFYNIYKKRHEQFFNKNCYLKLNLSHLYGKLEWDFLYKNDITIKSSNIIEKNRDSNETIKQKFMVVKNTSPILKKSDTIVIIIDTITLSYFIF